ncbi:MAG TPA: phosphoribosylaminoimidazolesuccinocarboxamide synthase [Vicinamibacteria bacterium]|nr:phosphoribosylaminoimidazolesuccinocarboxamide synthase [Vicinamibacteria bacterium]
MPLETVASPLVETRLPLPLWRRGKVRDVYDLGDRLLVVATDRLSAFDVVLPTGIPGKGVVLTQLSLFWFRLLADVAASHLLSAEVDEYPLELHPFRRQLEGRSMLVVKTDPLPVECVVRGYLSGSGWKDYRATGAICGIPLPRGLRESERLEPPLFTPATKAESGHDENIPFAEVERRVGRARAAEAREKSLAIYARARAHAETRGIILADTKFEFGSREEGLLWIDEALTPDSSRFWPKEGYAPGGSPPSFDKQYVRDYLESLAWDKRPPGPELPPEVVARTVEKYREALARLRGPEPRAEEPAAAGPNGSR